MDQLLEQSLDESLTQAVVEDPISSPSAWRAESLNETEWRLRFTEREAELIRKAAKKAAAATDDPTVLSQADFPLPGLDQKLLALPGQLEGGLGFSVLSGIPVADLSDHENLVLLWGLGTYLGEPEPQDKAGALMHIVTDTGQSVDNTDNVRGFQTNNELAFHTDGADVFALLCVRQGRSGGDSRLVSSTAVFNELVTTHPEYARILQEPFHFDARAQNPWEQRIQSVPIFTHHAGYMSALYKRRYIELAQRFDDVPRLTEAQIAAMDTLDRIAADPALAMYFRLTPGDLVIANNYSCFHARTEYEDFADASLRRRMHRLWLTLPNGRPLPAVYADTREWGLTYERRLAQAS
ncbi:MAG: TauD/TfdA family dioxygenase [Gammaproteobacteria bacterium]|nr:TauD/TfdA family dioxygenase [Gammaproteobacteria bacterium]